MMLHHVSIVATDLDRSVAFYRNVFGLEQIERPPFSTVGAWFACGALQIHIIVNPAGTFRRATTIDTAGGHFAFRTDDFEGCIRGLIAKGFREDAPEGRSLAVASEAQRPGGVSTSLLARSRSQHRRN